MVIRLQRTIRGRNALLNLFEMWVALAGVISGLVFFYSPASIDHNSLSVIVGYWPSVVWNIAYFAAGLMIWYGLLRPSPRWETVGLFLLGGATAVNATAIGSVFGLRGAATATTLFALTFAAWLRASFVVRTAVRIAEEHHDASPSR